MKTREVNQLVTNLDAFNTICNLAITHDHPRLSEFLKSGFCVGEFHGATNPIMHLAREGQIEAVYFLIRHFYGNKNHAVEGAAQGRHYALTLQLLAEGAMANYAVRGAAASGDEAFTFQLINEYGGSSIYAAKGAGYGGQTELCFKIIGLHNEATEPYFHHIYNAIAGAALGGQFKLFQSALQLLKNAHQYITAYTMAVEYAAQAGYEHLLENVMLKPVTTAADLFSIKGQAKGSGDCQNYHDINNPYLVLTYEIPGLANGGHYQQTLSCLTGTNVTSLNSEKRKKLFREATYAAIEGGHYDLMMALLELEPPESIHAMIRAIQYGHVDIVNCLAKKYPDDIRQSLLNDARFKFDNRLIPKKSTLRFIAFIDHEELRDSLIVNPEIHMIEIEKQIHQQAGRLNSIMQQFNLNLRQAQATSQIELRMFFLQVIPHIQPLLQYNIPRDIVVKIASYIANMPQKEMSRFYEIFLTVVVLNLQKKHPDSISNYAGYFRGKVTAVDMSTNKGMNAVDEPMTKKLKL